MKYFKIRVLKYCKKGSIESKQFATLKSTFKKQKFIWKTTILEIFKILSNQVICTSNICTLLERLICISLFMEVLNVWFYASLELI